MTIRVLYDQQIFHFQRYGGISRYFTELIKVFTAGRTVEPVLPFRYTANEYLLNLGGKYSFIRPAFLGDLEFPYKGGLWSLMNRMFPFTEHSKKNEADVLQMMQTGSFDIYHPTYYDSRYFRQIGSKKIVVTIHDLIYERFPEYFDPKEVQEVLKNKKESIERADHIIVVSESVKNDVAGYYNVRSERMTVVHHGVPRSTDHMSSHEIKTSLPDEYILFVGTRTGYKNFDFMLSSIRDVILGKPGLCLICTGNPFTAKERTLIRSLHLQDRILHRNVSDRELYRLYSHAILFIFPSLYEGFGIPVLEAMEHGCPAVLSDRSSLPEVGGDAALYFDPENAQSIAAAVQECLANTDQRTSMIEQGKLRASLFSWERAASETASIYQRVLPSTQNTSNAK